MCVALDKGVDAVRDHRDGSARHLLQKPVVFAGSSVEEEDNLGDVFRLVSDALHVGDHFECGGNLAQIACDGLLLEQKPQAERFNGALFLIDLRVERRDLLCKRAVALVERLCREGNDFLAQSAHADHFTVQLVELLVKPVSHHPNLPVM